MAEEFKQRHGTDEHANGGKKGKTGTEHKAHDQCGNGKHKQHRGNDFCRTPGKLESKLDAPAKQRNKQNQCKNFQHDLSLLYEQQHFSLAVIFLLCFHYTRSHTERKQQTLQKRWSVFYNMCKNRPFFSAIRTIVFYCQEKKNVV